MPQEKDRLRSVRSHNDNHYQIEDIMQEKNPQEKAAAARQAELIINALERAKTNNGVWLNPQEKTAPRFYPRGVTVSAFNALTMALHSDENGYKTNEYTLFTEAKKRGEAVQSNEHGVPFYWYNWKEYAGKQNPDDRISREAYQALDPKQQEGYKGVRTREVRTLFNIDQTTMQFVDKAQYDKEVTTHGTAGEREHSKSEDNHLTIAVNDFLLKMRDNLVPIRKDGSGVAHYDEKKDTVYMPSEKTFASYKDFANELMRQVAGATGSVQLLARSSSGNVTSPDDAKKQERLITELAAGSKMLELGLPARLSPESMRMVDYWQRELKENPRLIDVIEADVNNAVDMMHKAERGEKVERSSTVNRQQTADLQAGLPKHFFIADEIKELPTKASKEFVLVRDAESKSVDVVLPAGASLEVNNEVPGMSKARIEKALRKEGFEQVHFFNMDGALGYRHDDSYFAGKEVSVDKLNNWNLNETAKLDVSDAVRRANAVTFDKVLMMKDDCGKWAMFLKPENEKSFAVYPDKADVNRFFVTMKQGDEEASDLMRQEMASKYYAMATHDPSVKFDLFKSQATAEELARIERVNIFKTKGTENKPGIIICSPTIDGKRLQGKEVSPLQWQCMWLADDKQDYKTHLAASLVADVLRKEQSNSVAVGTDKTEQEAQTETKEQTKQVEFHEENDKQERKEEEKAEEQVHSEKKEEEKRRNSPEQKEKERQEEKAKEEATKAETKVAAAVILSPMMKQFMDLKSKHPDALMLFRTGDFYETYQDDARKASKILGITLTKSSKQNGPDGKPVQMAGFPYHALDTYLPKLIRAGERVAICDQLEAPKQTAKRSGVETAMEGKQEVKEVVTPAQKQEEEQTQHRSMHR